MHLFTYGTLRQGFGNHYHLHGCDYLGCGIVADTLMLDLGGFPGAVFAKAPEAGWVRGEIYNLAPYETHRLGCLDTLEQEGSLYKRVMVFAITPQGRVPCWLYIYLPPLSCSNIVEEGVWDP